MRPVYGLAGCLLFASCLRAHYTGLDAGTDAAPDEPAAVEDAPEGAAEDAEPEAAPEGTGGAGEGGSGVGGGGAGGAGTGGSPGVGGSTANPPTAGQVLIVEIMADSAAAIAPAGLTSDDVGEWVELESQVDATLDLYGCLLADVGNSETISAHVLIPPRSLVTLSRSAPGFVADYVYSAVKFADGGDVARLVCGAAVVDAVDFRAGFALMQGYSLSRDTSGAWCAPSRIYNATAKGVDRGTPGAVNDPCGDR